MNENLNSNDNNSSKRVSREKEFKRDISKKLQKFKDKRANKERELSEHVQSRWYRAPEVILLD